VGNNCIDSSLYSKLLELTCQDPISSSKSKKRTKSHHKSKKKTLSKKKT
jgi:hypothetical protein